MQLTLGSASRARARRGTLAAAFAVAALVLPLSACVADGPVVPRAAGSTVSASTSSAPSQAPSAVPTPEPATPEAPAPAPLVETPAEATVEPSPEPEPEPEPEPSTQEPAPQTPRSGSGTFVTAGLDTGATAGGRVVRIALQVEDGVPVDPMDFAAQIMATLTDPRGWQGVDGIAFVVTSDPGAAAFIVTLATPATTDRLCYPLDTGGWLDCYNNGRAVINSDRWLLGAESWGADIAGYRQMVVNHEVGHALGHGHLFCPGGGEPAPVMQQQTISLQGCAPNAWPSVTGG